ncbi:MAG: cytochrome-c peroxidase [Saprospiraceae bacterium]|nr:cytochrome-c peroxidase [Saprospiraceae bacterium]MCB9319158.1 cytochrome-c peroxidase [Lewinellaceae bacterium]
MRPRLLFFIIVTILSFTQCKKDSISTSNELDDALTSLIRNASPNGSLSYFVLPSNTDYATIPQDPRNGLSESKVLLGEFLFHETHLAEGAKYASGIHTYSCATCHHSAAGFQSGMRQAISDGGMGFGFRGESRVPNPDYPFDSLDVQPIRTPSAMNGAYQEVTLWNGQFGGTGMNVGTEASWTAKTPKEANLLGYEGLETQAIAGLNVHRMVVDRSWIESMPVYKDLFDKAFPEMVENERYHRITAGLAIAAYERTLLSNQAPFQKWLQGDDSALTTEEKEGAVLFFGKANCVSCHTGPALNSMAFYALGIDDLAGSGVYGNFEEDKTNFGRGGFTGKEEDMFKFKVPQLYNLADVKFFGHGGTFKSLEEIIQYKNAAQPTNHNVPANQLAKDFQPLGLTPKEVQAIATFIRDGLYDSNLKRYVPQTLPSGYCFPNNDLQSKADMGCN